MRVITIIASFSVAIGLVPTHASAKNYRRAPTAIGQRAANSAIGRAAAGAAIPRAASSSITRRVAQGEPLSKRTRNDLRVMLRPGNNRAKLREWAIRDPRGRIRYESFAAMLEAELRAQGVRVPKPPLSTTPSNGIRPDVLSTNPSKGLRPAERTLEQCDAIIDTWIARVDREFNQIFRANRAKRAQRRHEARAQAQAIAPTKSPRVAFAAEMQRQKERLPESEKLARELRKQLRGQLR
jgi:hypothetical protein